MLLWNDIEGFLQREAEDDLAADGVVQPALAAFAGDHGRFIAWLRPHPKGAYHEPLIELFALAMSLGADRLALSVSGRVWSLDDPIPPVSEDADLRQRALILHLTDGASGRPRSCSRLIPFEFDPGGAVAWQEAIDPGRGEGWISRAMEVAIRRRRRLRASEEDIREQAHRVSALGHRLWVPPDMADRLGLTPIH